MGKIRARGEGEIVIADSISSLMLMALVLLIAQLHFLITADAATTMISCSSSFCGSTNISSPFRLKGENHGCGKFEVDCENNRPTFMLVHKKYYVERIFYSESIIHLLDPDILNNNDYCSIPLSPLVSIPLSPLVFSMVLPFGYPLVNSTALYFLSCTAPINSSNYIDFSACSNHTSFSIAKYPYVAVQINSSYEIHDSCYIINIYPIISRNIDFGNLSVSYIHNELLKGFELEWYPDFSFKLSFLLRFSISVINLWISHKAKVTVILLTMAGLIICRTSVGILLMTLFCIHRCHRKHLSIDDTIEDFLQSHNNLMPIRYSFSEIKQTTNNFKDKLGQGGFGMVFKAKLRSGHLAAIKLLGNSKATGQDFINEVATIGRIHHVNVVKLIGFCVEGSKRALVYDYMPNGSLDKFIFCNTENETPLSWERMCDIALGVARGIEYLHRGCDMQILHFDIKPHNILLDENFVPKVSDFGLAKLYSTDDSIVSLTAARGTLGYIAPELFYKNIGGVSYKADVYSFGMLLMEMVGRRRNVKADAAHSSQIYFPSWIYDRIRQGNDMELGSDVTEDMKRLVKKMTVVATWCIQMKPVDRPSMSEVLEMLESEAQELQIPPKPFFHPQDNPIIEAGASASTSSHSIDISTTSSIF